MTVTRRRFCTLGLTGFLSGCAGLGTTDETTDTPPFVVENESSAVRTVDLTVWEVGPLSPIDGRGDSFREDFESAAENGATDESDYERRETYDLTVEPGSAAAPVESSDATGLLYLLASTDYGEEIGLWIETDGPDEAFFADISVYEDGMSATTGEY